MEVVIGKKPFNGKREMTIQFLEQIDGFTHTAEVKVIVPESDSLSQLNEAALQKSYEFFELVLSARSEGHHQE